MRYVLALDQGTTSSRAILFDENQRIVSSAQKEFKQIFPKSGWVEHDPMDIFSSQYAVMLEAVSKSGVDPKRIAAIGIANQRETTIVWDKNTGLPVYNAIVWQCRRTAEICKDLEKKGMSDYIKKTTGLLPDAYFSGPKVKWILDNVKGARERAERGELLMGTVDTWLIWKLTGGVIHATDYTNASRTMLFDINKLCWDKKLVDELGIPSCMLPEVRPCSGVFGYVDILGAKIPIAGVAGDQQAALMGQTCTEEGETKNTYGTGCFLLMNTGSKPVISENGLVTTIASYMNGKVSYALEGSIFVGGAVIQWLRDEMKFITESPEAETLASKVPDTGGVYFVPAFTGLGAPHWDMYARGCIIGITRATSREHIVRAAQESIAYQVAELVSVMEKETGCSLPSLRVDGGAARDAFLLQFESDIMDKTIQRPAVTETTALGAAFFAGLAAGVWKSVEDIRSTWECSALFTPKMDEEERSKLLRGWHKAVDRSLSWAEE